MYDCLNEKNNMSKQTKNLHKKKPAKNVQAINKITRFLGK